MSCAAQHVAVSGGRRRLTMALAWVLLASAACSSSGESTTNLLPASIDVFVDYPRYLWHLRRLAIATTNNGTEPISISQIVLRAEHFEPLNPEMKTTVIQPGTRTDVQVDFGELTNCNHLETPNLNASVEMWVSVGDEAPTQRVAELDPAPLDDMRRRECGSRRVHNAVTVSFRDDATIADNRMSITIGFDRGTGIEPITITRIQGSEVFAMLPQTVDPLPTLEPDTAAANTLVTISIKGCNPHLVGQSTRTFDLKVWVQLGDEEATELVLIPIESELKDELANMIQVCIADTDS